MSSVRTPRETPDPETTTPHGVTLVSLPLGRDRFKTPHVWASFGHAWRGILETARTQRNFRIHLGIALGAILLGVSLGMGRLEWLLLLSLTGLVLAAELMNTALEAFVDLVTDGRYHPQAKRVKDASAGAVFVLALASVAVGTGLFVPHLLWALQ